MGLYINGSKVGVRVINRVVFREQFQGSPGGATVTYPLTGTGINATFRTGAWESESILNTLQAYVTGTNYKPIYDSVIPLLRNKIEISSINTTTGIATLTYPPRAGVDFYIWYWYDLHDWDVLEDYYREDFVTALEAEGGGGSGDVYIYDLDSSNILTPAWNEDDNADRILRFLMNSGDRTIDLAGDINIDGDLSTDGSLTVKTNSSPRNLDLIGDNYIPYTGWPSDPDVTVSFNNGNRTLTITDGGTGYYYIQGTRYDLGGNKTVQIDDTDGIWYIYITGSTLTATQTPFDFSSDSIAFVAILLWDSVNSKQIYLGSELHSYIISSRIHGYLHNTRGAQLESGGALGDIVAGGNGSSDSHCQFSVSLTELWDEDLEYELSARGSTENIAVYYRDGDDADNIWRIDESRSFPVINDTLAVYNELSGGTWSLTELGSTHAMLAHVFAYNDTSRKFGVIMGQNDYTGIVPAREAAPDEINSLILSGLPFAEIKFLGTLVLQTSNSFTNTPKTRIMPATTEGDDYIDFRQQTFAAGGANVSGVDHGSLAGLGDDDHPQYTLTAEAIKYAIIFGD